MPTIVIRYNRGRLSRSQVKVLTTSLWWKDTLLETENLFVYARRNKRWDRQSYPVVLHVHTGSHRLYGTFDRSELKQKLAKLVENRTGITPYIELHVEALIDISAD